MRRLVLSTIVTRGPSCPHALAQAGSWAFGAPLLSVRDSALAVLCQGGCTAHPCCCAKGAALRCTSLHCSCAFGAPVCSARGSALHCTGAPCMLLCCACTVPVHLHCSFVALCTTRDCTGTSCALLHVVLMVHVLVCEPMPCARYYHATNACGVQPCFLMTMHEEEWT